MNKLNNFCQQIVTEEQKQSRFNYRLHILANILMVRPAGTKCMHICLYICVF